ncbi:hypothetical protein [Streptomyces sp. NPDC001070]
MNALTPAAGAAVMATGILSAGLRLAGYEGAALAALALAGAVWAVCAGAFAARLSHGRERWRREAMTPAGLTGAAATCVLGTCLSLQGWQEAAALALALSAALWPLLLVAVVRGWERGLPGVVFLVCVATEGLAVGAGTLAVPFRLPCGCSGRPWPRRGGRRWSTASPRRISGRSTSVWPPVSTSGRRATSPSAGCPSWPRTSPVGTSSDLRARIC